MAHLDTLSGKALVDAAISDVGEIATLPEVTVKIIQIVENPKSTARDLHEVIKNDPALSARILKVVNSAFYGLPGQISSIDRAIVLLGLSAVKNIAIAASMTHLFNSGPSIEGFSGAEVWKHSIAMGVTARLLSAAQGKPAVEECFLAGIIADLGLLVARQVFPKQLAEVIAEFQATGQPYCDIENKIIGADHQAFGAALAAKWRFPQNLCTTIGYHHRPEALAASNQELPTLVCLADILVSKAAIGFCTYREDDEVPQGAMDVLKLTPEKVQAVLDQIPDQVASVESIFAS